ncbi:MAG: biotin carboxylase N-terminal domain-containing protein [Dehalococcoidia bacterium]
MTKLLVANRGEIAVRVVRTARRLGYRTVAIYSDADCDSEHRWAADESVCIGGARPADSYLDIGKVVLAAKASGAGLVHPGYGFLAENAAFAAACREAGLVFVGPSPEAIEAMGNKARAKQLMEAAGVPCIPGYRGPDQSGQHLFEQAKALGWPVMIKAVAGGGGRGMRLVTGPLDFSAALVSAKSEAAAAFRDDEVLLERALDDPRHIEIQIVADRYGNAIHLGERDCSVQRRHQKVVEEAPSPAVGPELRDRMGSTATAAAQAIGYEGAGTFEFLLDSDGGFYFMEMNTRLQVEHPVTEAITGLDLVELQLRIAAGEPLPLRQSEVRFSGHAIEVRLCAENADADFMPQSGVMARWQVPPDLRVEHAMRSGSTVSPYYDSMIAKLVSHAYSREAARRTLVAGLDRTTALGVQTNRAFLRRCLSHPVFAAGEATTAFVSRAMSTLRTQPGGAVAAARVSACLMQNIRRPLSEASPALVYSGSVSVRLVVNGDVHEVIVARTGAGTYRCSMNDEDRLVGISEVREGTCVVTLEGVSSEAQWVADRDVLWLQLCGEDFVVRDTSLEGGGVAGGAETGDGKVRASMTGRVVALHVEAGAVVAAGQHLVTLEAMKIEQTHVAAFAGTIKSIHVIAGDQVSAGFVLAEIDVVQEVSG